MSKTNDNSNIATEDHEMLEDAELNAVTGGTLIPTSVDLGELTSARCASL